MTAAIVDVGDGRRADFERLGATAKGAIALVHSKPMMSFDDLFAEYQLGPETMQAAVDARAGGHTVHLDTPAGPAVPPHDVLGSDFADPDGAAGARGRPAAGPPLRSGRRAARHAGHQEQGRRTRAGAQRRRRDPGQREAGRDRAARRAPRCMGPRHGRARQRRQLRARRGGGPRDRGRPEAETHHPVRALHRGGSRAARIVRVRRGLTARSSIDTSRC